MQKWYDWLEEMNKKDERKKMEELHQQKVNQMIKSVEGSAGLALDHEARSMEWESADLGDGEEDVRPLGRCEAKRKEWSKQWQCDASVQNMEDKLWNMKN